MQAQSKSIRHLHAHFGTQAATVARLAAAFAGIHYSFTAHAKDIYHQYGELVQLDLKIRDAAFTVTVSDYDLDKLVELGNKVVKKFKNYGYVFKTLYSFYNW